MGDWWPELRGELHSLGIDALDDKRQIRHARSAGPRQPRPGTKRRAQLYKTIKEQSPQYSQSQVAKAAALLDGGIGNKHTAETVRYTYRIMGWEWKRDRKVR